MCNQPGTLVIVVGLFGSGKSTLTYAAIAYIAKAKAVKTITTRLPRTNEERNGSSIEYEFVTSKEYHERKVASRKWDERTADDAWYGIDVAAVEDAVFAGSVCVLSLLPHTETLLATKARFACPTVAIFLQVPLEIANERLLQRGTVSKSRAALQTSLNVSTCSAACDRVFVPSGELEKDTATFCAMLQELCR